MGIIESLKRSIIRGISDSDIIDGIEKINELAENYEIVLDIQRENGKVEKIKIISFEVIKHK